MKDAKLIVLSALDGGGKNIQCELVKSYLDEHKYKYIHLHFPMYGNNEASNVIASYLRGEYGNIDKVNPVFVANMYAMDRFLYLPELQKHMNENDVVLLNRYVFCNMAYQGAKYDTDTQSNIIKQWIDEFEFGFLELPYPDLNIFFDVPISIIEKRLKTKREGEDREYLNGKSDIHESDIKFQERVRENYLGLKSYQNFTVVQCAEENEKEIIEFTPEEIFERYRPELDKLILTPKY